MPSSLSRLTLRAGLFGAVLFACSGPTLIAHADQAQLNPAALAYKLPDQIPWEEMPEVPGIKQAVIYGDPSKPGLYVMLVKWEPYHTSHPHYHPHDRIITVLTGTWWVATGNHYDPNTLTPMPAGSVVKHFGQQVHYDGVKDQESIIEIVGEGPGTLIPVPEEK